MASVQVGRSKIQAARAAGLDAGAIAWVAEGDRGRSSETLFSVLTGVSLLSPLDYAVPFDPDDLGRCRKLLEAVPSIAIQLGRMAEIGPGWQGLVKAWPDLCATMDAEVPTWRDGAGRAPATYQAICAAVGSHRR